MSYSVILEKEVNKDIWFVIGNFLFISFFKDWLEYSICLKNIPKFATLQCYLFRTMWAQNYIEIYI